MNSVNFPDCAGVLFDFGGTLDSDGGHWFDRFLDLYRAAGFDLPEEDIKRAFYRADVVCEQNARTDSWGLRTLMRYHVDLQFADLGLEHSGERARMVDSFCRESETCLRRNAELLRRLNQRFRLGVVSNFYGNVAVLCEEAGLTSSLGVVLDSARFGSRKPDAAIFLAALDRLEMAPERVVYVGDSYERDMLPARRLGMKAVWMKGPCPRIPADAEPLDGCISSLTELESFLS